MYPAGKPHHAENEIFLCFTYVLQCFIITTWIMDLYLRFDANADVDPKLGLVGQYIDAYT
jgi:hypothetical protein